MQLGYSRCKPAHLVEVIFTGNWEGDNWSPSLLLKKKKLMSFVLCRKSTTDQYAFFYKDLSAARVTAADKITLYFNSSDSDSPTVNTVLLTTASGKSDEVLESLSRSFESNNSLFFDDVNSVYSTSDVTAVTTVTFNGVPSTGVYAKTAVEVLSADKTITNADSGKTFLINKADGLTVTMPDSTADSIGQVYTFIVKTAVTSNAVKFGLNDGDFFTGTVVGHTGGFAANGSSNDFINLDGSTTGGAGGDIIRLVYTEEGFVHCEGQLNSSGTQATSFADA